MHNNREAWPPPSPWPIRITATNTCLFEPAQKKVVLSMTTSVKRRTIRRLALLTVAAVTALTTATACGDDGGGGTTGGPVTLKLFTQTPQGGSEGPYPATVKKFEAANPNIKVEINTAQDYSNVLRTQLQGGSGPDVFYVTGGGGNIHAVLPLAQQNQLKELTADWAKKAVPESARSHFSREGKQYALPVDLVPITQTVNLTTYKELGLSPAKTLDELYSQCAAAAARGKSLFAVAGAVPPNLALHVI